MSTDTKMRAEPGTLPVLRLGPHNLKREVPKTNACKGYCCMAFNLPYTLAEIKKIAAKKEPRYQDSHSDETWLSAHETWRSNRKIADMLIYLGEHLDNPTVGMAKDGTRSEPTHWYTCKWFDGEALLCTNYDDRPFMCSSFPNNQPSCPYDGCRHTNGKELAKQRAFNRRLKVFGVATKAKDTVSK